VSVVNEQVNIKCSCSKVINAACTIRNVTHHDASTLRESSANE